MTNNLKAFVLIITLLVGMSAGYLISKEVFKNNNSKTQESLPNIDVNIINTANNFELRRVLYNYKKSGITDFTKITNNEKVLIGLQAPFLIMNQLM